MNLGKKPSGASSDELKDFAGHLAFQHVEQEILSGHDAITLKRHLNGLACQFGMVVFLAEVTEPDMAQFGRGILGKRNGAFLVREVSFLTVYAVFQILWIRS